MLILASRSPRRAELLQAAGIPFTVEAPDIDETPREGEAPRDYVLRMAVEKASAVPGDFVLAADTTVVVDDEILGKPVDAADAARMLEKLSGRRHEVLTGVCVQRRRDSTRGVVSTAVWFHPMSARDIADYVASGEPLDKAGAYGIQGLASKFVEKIEGSYSNVVGLPVDWVWRHL